MLDKPLSAILTKIRNWFERKSSNHLRQTHYKFDGETICGGGLFARRVSIRVSDIDEIGIETTDTGPFAEDVFWLINKDTDSLRIPQESPVFEALMERFSSFEGFDWGPFSEAIACTDDRYFLCWRQSREST